MTSRKQRLFAMLEGFRAGSKFREAAEVMLKPPSGSRRQEDGYPKKFES